MDYKRYLKAILPYGVVCLRRRWIEKRTPKLSVPSAISPCNMFLQEVKNYKNGNNIIQYDKESKFRHIVSVQGFGRTGSSAIVDLLREYSSTVVIGYVDPVNSKAIPNKIDYEVTFVRDSGSLSEIEKFIGSTNRFNQDAVLHRFILLITKSLIYKNCPEVRPFFYRFFSDIAIIQDPVPDQRYYNKHLHYNGNIDILSLKKITIQEYRQLVKLLLVSVTNTFYDIGKDTLVLDQFFLDSDYSDSEKRVIVPNIKTIVSIRDPRDVYSFIRRTSVKWIPYDNPLKFVDWYKERAIITNDDSENKITIRFEDLMDNYDTTVNEIERFLQINSETHIRKYACFDPNLSRNSYMIWKKEKGRETDFLIIHAELKYLCYED